MWKPKASQEISFTYSPNNIKKEHQDGFKHIKNPNLTIVVYLLLLFITIIMKNLWTFSNETDL